MKIAHEPEEIQKIYVNQDGVASIKCSGCEAVKTLKVDKFKGEKHILKVKCSCMKLFPINLEFRKFYRKPTKLPGNYVLLPEKIHRGRMMVANISKGGLGLQILGIHRLTPGQKIHVNFTLDDKHGSLIDKLVVVRLVEKNFVCCEFTGNTSNDKALGFYLMA